MCSVNIKKKTKSYNIYLYIALYHSLLVTIINCHERRRTNRETRRAKTASASSLAFFFVFIRKQFSRTSERCTISLFSLDVRMRLRIIFTLAIYPSNTLEIEKFFFTREAFTIRSFVNKPGSSRTFFSLLLLINLIESIDKIDDRLRSSGWHADSVRTSALKEFTTIKGIPLSDLQHCPKHSHTKPNTFGFLSLRLILLPLSKIVYLNL